MPGFFSEDRGEYDNGKETPPGLHPPVMSYGAHSSFLHTILYTWF